MHPSGPRLRCWLNWRRGRCGREFGNGWCLGLDICRNRRLGFILGRGIVLSRDLEVVLIWRFFNVLGRILFETLELSMVTVRLGCRVCHDILGF